MLTTSKISARGKWRAMLALLLLSLTLGGRVSMSNALAQESPEIGAVDPIALDSAGNGWAWANPAPQKPGTSFLLRIENGSWRVFADSQKSPALLPPGLQVRGIEITNKGNEGWAIGVVTANEKGIAIMWRLQGGTWSVYRPNLGANIIFNDIAIAPDGSDGWLAGFDERTEQHKLYRLRDGKWESAPLPASGGALTQIALSPDGKSGWAVGPRNESANTFAQHAAYRLNNGRWAVVAGDLYMPEFAPLGLTADNLGNGWVIAVFAPDLAANRTGVAGSTMRGVETAAQPLQRSVLWRLSANAKPRVVELNLPKPPVEQDVEFSLSGVVVDGAGRGWASGSFFLGIREDPPEYEYLYQPVFFRLQGDNVTLVPNAAIGYEGEENLAPFGVAMTRDGAHSWVGSHNGTGFGRLAEIREAWTHDKPPAATPLPGAGRCFAEVPHCLRGVFATYWTQKGGLDLFGFPITPEVRETLGGKTYTVQYTQRARFEYHPENKAPYDVLLGLLGNTLSEPRQNEEPFKPKPPGIVPSEEWFEQTQHNVRPPFLDYWKKNGGLPVFGLPKSEAFEEKNAADGKVYLVQYFERNRLEYHPELKGTKFEMLLGLLGTEQFMGTYGYAP